MSYDGPAIDRDRLLERTFCASAAVVVVCFRRSALRYRCMTAASCPPLLRTNSSLGKPRVNIDFSSATTSHPVGRIWEVLRCLASPPWSRKAASSSSSPSPSGSSSSSTRGPELKMFNPDAGRRASRDAGGWGEGELGLVCVLKFLSLYIYLSIYSSFSLSRSLSLYPISLSFYLFKYLSAAIHLSRALPLAKTHLSMAETAKVTRRPCLAGAPVPPRLLRKPAAPGASVRHRTRRR